MEAAEVRSSASGLPSSSSAPTLPRVVPHRATAAELKARVTLPSTSPAALQWAASGAFGVGGQPGAAVAAAAAAVRRVGGANPAQSFPRLPRSGGGTSRGRRPTRRPTRPRSISIDGDLVSVAIEKWYNSIGQAGAKKLWNQNKPYPCTACCKP